MNDQFQIPKWAWAIPIVLGLLLLGYFASPRGHDERPILLLPDIKAVEDYRRSISLWQAQAGELDAQITTILSGAHGSDLFARSRAAQKMIDDAVQLLQDIESNKAPTAAMPARGILVRMASTYLEAARATLLWTTAPTDDNLSSAQAMVDHARQILGELEASEWVMPR